MMIFRLRGCARVIMAVSSANCSTVVEIEGRETRSFSKRLNSICRTFVAKMNKRGDRGSPWRKPRR
jgi:hypothetical protein